MSLQQISYSLGTLDEYIVGFKIFHFGDFLWNIRILGIDFQGVRNHPILKFSTFDDVIDLHIVHISHIDIQSIVYAEILLKISAVLYLLVE